MRVVFTISSPNMPRPVVVWAKRDVFYALTRVHARLENLPYGTPLPYTRFGFPTVRHYQDWLITTLLEAGVVTVVGSKNTITVGRHDPHSEQEY